MAKDGVFMTEELVERLREELNIPDSEHRIFYDPQSEEEHCCDDDCRSSSLVFLKGAAPEAYC